MEISRSWPADEAEAPLIGNRTGGGIDYPAFEQGYILIKGQILHDSLRGRPQALGVVGSPVYRGHCGSTRGHSAGGGFHVYSQTGGLNDWRYDGQKLIEIRVGVGLGGIILIDQFKPDIVIPLAVRLHLHSKMRGILFAVLGDF